MTRDRAAYMREYRAKRRVIGVNRDVRDFTFDDGSERIAELEEEVRHLKAELAKRPTEKVPYEDRPFAYDRYTMRPITPAPKPSQRKK